MTNAQNNVKYGKFTVEELFNVKGTKSTDAGKVHFVGKQDGDAQFIGRTNANYGLQGYVNSKDFAFEPNKANTISVSQVGTITAQYRDFPYYTSQNITKLSADFLNRQIGLYICSAINQWLRGAQFEGYHTLKMADLKKQQLILPVTPSGTPDFEYMEERIRELEEERIRELEAYLKVTGWSDATLTDEEQMALNKMNNGGITWKKFRVGDLFKINTGSLVSKRYLNANPGNVPRISVTTVDNGVIGYFDDTVDIPNIRYYKNFISVNFFGNVFYHPDKASVEMKVHVLQLKSGKALNRKIAMFLCGALSKVFDNGTYSYGNQLSSSKLKNNAFYIALPVTSAGDIDFDFMENYITAIEKQSIRGVIEYKDKVIQTTKNIVNAN